MKKILLLAITLVSALSISAQPKYEVRAVWLTTNSGLDWPKGVYDETTQKENLCEILDKLADANFNTIIFQAQVKGDVLWESTMQPAMRAITGNGSKSMSYDVSEYVIEECHKRNMECHAWIVPYRIGTSSDANKYVSNKVKHPLTTNPELCVEYNGSYYLDPGLPETREYLLDVYRELIFNYDYDGVNFDYTRYPGSDFDDADSYAKYNPDALPKDDWRRQNINTFIAEFYEMAKSINPNIKVGAAPIGTYKNVSGFGNMTAYGSVYQDACQWMQSGNHDLLVPQMYWNEKNGFTPNMSTWVTNCDGRQLVIGLAPYKMVDGSNNWEVSVITDQIEKIRNNDGTSGICFFRADHVIDDSQVKIADLYDELQNNYFKYPAHIVPMDYNGVTKPNAPENVKQEYINGQYIISWDVPSLDVDNTPLKYYSVYLSDGESVDLDDPQQVVAHITKDNELVYSSDDLNLRFAVTTFDKNYYESEPAISEISGVDETLTEESNFHYSNDMIYINSSNHINVVEVYSILGSCYLYQSICGNEATISCESLPNGVYIVRTICDNGATNVNKFIR